MIARVTGRRTADVAQPELQVDMQNPDVVSSIPRHIVITEKASTMNELHPDIRMNVDRNFALNPGFEALYYGDSQCEVLLESFGDEALLKAFRGESHGAYRGDICRAVALFEKGGYYLDVDVQMAVPFSDIVAPSATFFSALAATGGGVLNAIIGVVPKSEIIAEHLAAIRHYYTSMTKYDPFATDMGPKTLQKGLQSVTKRLCHSTDLVAHQGEVWQCGDARIQLMREEEIDCKSPGTLDCPKERADGYGGLRYGLYDPSKEHKLIGWSRFAECKENGCGGGGNEGWRAQNFRPQDLVREHLALAAAIGTAFCFCGCTVLVCRQSSRSFCAESV